MVDLLALSLSHALLAFAVWQLLRRGDLDVESTDRTERDDVEAGTPVSGRQPVRRGVVWPGAQGESGAAEQDA
ncbi:hypothetical protein [Novosphingobium sp. 9]|uniref:hypothetical protein n=1 Tax=Novosphingobium sp. 9 TaxID=2025349 RepID=UPI0021B5CC69|nr:hypothetical protein [Novosphingobium sp. 9]